MLSDILFIPSAHSEPLSMFRQTLARSFRASPLLYPLGPQTLLQNNKKWAEGMVKEDPKFFEKLAPSQSPQFLWIGCSDSRVPASTIAGTKPGDIFLHCNIANVVVPSDINCLSVMQYAVEHLRVRHVIVCGHYGCGGVKAAWQNIRLGVADNWTRHIRDVHSRFRVGLAGIPDQDDQFSVMCELNVLSQLRNVSKTTVIKDAWAGGNNVALHGWIYGISDGLLKPIITLNHDTDKSVLGTRARELIAARTPK